MTAGLGRYDEFIDISGAENFQAWHNTPSLLGLTRIGQLSLSAQMTRSSTDVDSAGG
ncbi:hypothetical protein ACFYTS_34325 [Nocardia sp. NPDC004151]|uniref:hypothetical protein n=1 Tax=Nocardia sp. NPDC004151 TaxID=3364304 RepID=UPI0036B7CB33